MNRASWLPMHISCMSSFASLRCFPLGWLQVVSLLIVSSITLLSLGMVSMRRLQVSQIWIARIHVFSPVSPCTKLLLAEEEGDRDEKALDWGGEIGDRGPTQFAKQVRHRGGGQGSVGSLHVFVLTGPLGAQ